MTRRTLTAVLFAAALPLAGCSSLEKKMFSSNPLTRAQALEAAGKAGGKEQTRLAGALGRKLSHKRPEVRTYAAAALEDLGPAAAAAAAELIEALEDPESLVSGSAERTLTKLPGAVPALAAALARADQTSPRLGAILASHGDPGAAALAKNFEGGSRQAALRSAAALALMGPAAEKAIPGLARAASSADQEVRAAALAALSAVGEPAGRWLAAALASPAPRARAGAAAVLAAMPRQPPEAAEALAGALEDPDEKVRENSAAALAAYPAEVLAALPSELLPALIKAAAAPGAAAAPARLALVRTGKAPGKTLLEALYAEEETHREAAALALILMFPPPREPAAALFRALDDTGGKVRRAAAAAIGNYAVTAPDSLPKNAAALLGAALNNSDAETRRLATFPLGRMAAADKKALGALISALRHSDAAVRAAAASALGSAGAKAAAALPALWKAFRTRDCEQRAAAARALAAIKPDLKKNRQVARALRAVCPARPTLLQPSELPGLAPSPSKPSAVAPK